MAMDGVVEVNQVRAKFGYVTADDEPGFPVTLSASGSYRLTGNLDLSAQPGPQDQVAILITASHVTLDLNGFAIGGVTVCSGNPPATPVTCAPSGAGSGILGGTSAQNIVVANGTIHGMGGDGISLKKGGRVENVEARSNGSTGIEVIGSGTMVLGCRAFSNGAHGIAILEGGAALLRHNVVRGNGQSGIAAGIGSYVEGNDSAQNDEYGVASEFGSMLLGNTVRDNDISLHAWVGSVLVGNSVSTGGSFPINVGEGSLVSGNSIVNNAGLGLAFPSGVGGYGDNVLVVNNGGAETQVSGGLQIGSNFCGSNTTCP